VKQEEREEIQLLPLGAMASRLHIRAAELRAEAEQGRVPCLRVGTKTLLFDPVRVYEALRRRSVEEGK
jgi:hypothetical protein